MRAITLLRMSLVLTTLGSISVAGTAVVWSTSERLLSTAVQNVSEPDGDALTPVQTGQLEKQLRNYRVRLDANGRLPGRINIIDPNTGLPAPARDLTIALLQNGRKVTEFHPGINGVFEAEGVLPGVYSLVGHGEEGYIAYGLEVLPAVANVDLNDDSALQQVAFQEIGTELQIDSLAVPPQDGPSVLRLATEHLPAEIVAAASAIAANADAVPPAVDSGDLTELNEIEDNPGEETVYSANLHQHDIRLDANGSLTGRIRSLHPQTGQPVRIRRLNVFLVKNNQIVAQAPVTPLGVFTFPDLSEGTYSFVAAGT
ncbi:MAG: hypothetical protein KF861_18105, partial [Planctomycetaceae bacterium]|nr:hypothetical protein [Planctomycetaceae bacterium]